MNKLALTLPGFPANPIASPEGLRPEFVNLGSLISALFNIAFYIAVFVSFYFLVWGAFQYIVASGGKEDLGKARARITWALVGLIIIAASYFIAKFASEIFPPGRGGLPF